MIKELINEFQKNIQKINELAKEKLEQNKKNTHNSNISIPEEIALKQIKKAEELYKKNKQTNVTGIPFGAKDLFCVEGTKTTAGAKILENYIAPYTATAVQKLLDAGAILVAKENLDQFGHGSSSENTIFGPVKNALNPEKISGGSSGGSAVNVALGNTIFSLGTDTGGSIRQPAGLNKIFGFKPSYGRISRYGVIGYAPSLDTVGILAKDILDIVEVLNVIAGKDEKDLTTLDYKPIDTSKFDEIDWKGMKVGYFKNFLDYKGLHPEIKNSILYSLNQLEKLGAKVVPLDFFDGDLLVATYYILAMAETSSELAKFDGVKYGYRNSSAKDRKEIYLKSRTEGFSPETQRRIIIGAQVLSAGFENKFYFRAVVARKKIIKRFQEIFKKVDFIISPVTPNLTPKIGEIMNDPLAMYMSDLYTVGFSLGKVPTITIPGNSPTGMQITGSYLEDEKVLKIAYNLQKIFE